MLWRGVQINVVCSKLLLGRFGLNARYLYAQDDEETRQGENLRNAFLLREKRTWIQIGEKGQYIQVVKDPQSPWAVTFRVTGLCVN